jgi:hypothetical protein
MASRATRRASARNEQQKDQQQPALPKAQEREAQWGDLLHRHANSHNRASEERRGDERGGVGGEPLGDHGRTGAPLMWGFRAA